ncbi:hypothetical protein Bca4012_057488 [Brassica carinata]
MAVILTSISLSTRIMIAVTTVLSSTASSGSGPTLAQPPLHLLISISAHGSDEEETASFGSPVSHVGYLALLLTAPSSQDHHIDLFLFIGEPPPPCRVRTHIKYRSCVID